MSEALKPLLDALQGGAPRGIRPVDWRLFWTSSERSSVGVRDRMRAGVHAPLAISRGFVLDYLFQWEDGRISAGAAEKLGIADPEPFLALARQAAYDDPDGAAFAGPAAMPEVPLHSAAAAAEARSGGAGTFAGLVEAGASRAAKWGFGTWSGTVSAGSGEMGVATSRGLSVRAATTRVSYSFWYEGRTGDGHVSREPIAAAEAETRLERACDLVRRLGSPEPGYRAGDDAGAPAPRRRGVAPVGVRPDEPPREPDRPRAERLPDRAVRRRRTASSGRRCRCASSRSCR